METPQGLFTLLKAEQEPWLARAYIPPAQFETALVNTSTLIVGAPGSGKTALRLALSRHASQDYLMALWAPLPPDDDHLQGTPLVNFIINQAMQTCVETLLLSGSLPTRLGSPADWVLDSLNWYLNRYLPFAPDIYVQSQGAAISPDDSHWFLQLLQRPPRSIVSEGSTNKDRMVLLLQILKAAGYQGIWLVVDGLEKWTASGAQRIHEMLGAIFSTLAVFDLPGLAFKFVVQDALAEQFDQTAGLLKGRVERCELACSPEELRLIFTRRLNLLLGRDDLTHHSLCRGPKFWAWVERFAGRSPRLWLRYLHPYVQAYQSGCRQLTILQWRRLFRLSPPPFRLDSTRKSVRLEECEIPIGSEAEYRILEYLYARAGQVCSMEEVYYLCVEEHSRVPGRYDDGYVAKGFWRNALDQRISRLRAKFEPFPHQPIYLVTHPRKGYQLRHAAK